MLELSILFAIFLVTYFGVVVMRRWMMRRGLVTVPNERSSHTVPTPTGAGLVLSSAIVAGYASSAYLLDQTLSIGFVIGAVMIIIVSWLDDLYSISFIVRIAVQVLAAAVFVISLGHSSSTLHIADGLTITSAWLSPILMFAWIICLINSYNFMDGIDGMAGVQAIAAGIGYLAVGLLVDSMIAMIFGGLIAFASFAFLLHNWPPARIFLGDTGSAFLGFAFAAIPLLLPGVTNGGIEFPLLAGLSFVWIFVFDVGITSVRRTLHGQMLWQPSREHLYQRMLISGYSHRRITMIYGGLAAMTSLAGVISTQLQGPAAILLVAAAMLLTAAVVIGICWKRGVLWGMISQN